MLPPKERVTRNSLFQRAYTARKTINYPFFTLYVLAKTPRVKAANFQTSLANTERQVAPDKINKPALPLVGFVVAKKVSNSACLRNRAKRRVREAYRLLRQTDAELIGTLHQWYALVWVIHGEVLTGQWSQIKEQVQKCLKEADRKYGGQAAANQAKPTKASGQEHTNKDKQIKTSR